MQLRDRRTHDSNAAINLACVRGLIGIAAFMAVGSVGLAACGRPVPEFMGSGLVAITGGLVGYLSRDPKTSTGVNTDTVGTVNVATGSNLPEGSQPETDTKLVNGEGNP